VELYEAGYDVVIVDNLSNSNEQVIDSIEHITGKRPIFVNGDSGDERCLQHIFQTYEIDAVMHFAGLKAVAESCEQPFRYRQENII